jgi:8-oxo-dGTP diphosphatase
LVAACALIDPDGRVLVAQRPPGKGMAGLWEFPGGKVEPGERPEETVIREFHEELAITISEPCLAPFTFASHTYPDFQLLMPLFVCRRWEGIATAREHTALKWLKPRELTGLAMPPADQPLVAMLRDLL